MYDNKKWYILKVASRYEEKVKNYILSYIKCDSLFCKCIGRIIVPKEGIYKKKKNKRTKVFRLYFPGYILIEMSYMKKLLNFILKIPKVSFILSNKKNGLPFSINSDELNKILCYDNNNINLLSGDIITIIKGKFKGFNGIIKYVDVFKNKYVISVIILGKEIILKLSFNYIRPLSKI